MVAALEQDEFRLFTDMARKNRLNFDLRQLSPGEYNATYHFHRYAKEFFSYSRERRCSAHRKDWLLCTKVMLCFLRRERQERTNFTTILRRLAVFSICALLTDTKCANPRIPTNSFLFRTAQNSGSF